MPSGLRSQIAVPGQIQCPRATPGHPERTGAYGKHKTLKDPARICVFSQCGPVVAVVFRHSADEREDVVNVFRLGMGGAGPSSGVDVTEMTFQVLSPE